MKNLKKRMFVFLAVLASLRATSAAITFGGLAGGVCGDTGSGTPANADFCTCPAGTGKIAASTTITTGLSAGTGYTITATTTTGVTTMTLTTAGTSVTSVALAGACTDILPGYAFLVDTSGSILPSLCPADSFCPGLAAVLVPLTATTITAYDPNAVVTLGTSGWLTAITAGDDTPIPCPANTGTNSVTGNLALNQCLVNVAYYVATAYVAGTTSPVVSQCPAGSACTTAGQTGASVVVAPLVCTTQTAFICPAGTYGSIAGTAVAASDFNTLTGDVVCDPTTRTGDATAATCIAKAGYFGAADPAGGAATVCPTGSTGPAAPSTVTTTNVVCTQLKAGYAIALSAARGSAPTACPTGSYCVGAAVATPTLAAGVTSAISYQLFGTQVCAAGSTTASTGATATTGCSVLRPGYYIPSGAAAGANPSLCLAGSYCPGSASPVPALASTITLTAAATFGLTACPIGTTSGPVVATSASGIQIAIANYPVGAAGTSTSPLNTCSMAAAGYYLPIAEGTSTLCRRAALGITTTAGSCGYPLPCAVNSYCPAGTTNVLSLNTATITDIATVSIQGTTSGAANTVMVSTNAVTAATNVACSANFGNGGTSAVSAATGCNSIQAGYYLQSGSTLPVACVAAAGSYCPGFSTGAYTGVTISTNAVTNTATTATGVVSCPTGTTGAANQASIAAACTDLAAGYALVPSVTTTKLASLIYACPTGATCAGIAGFFGGSFSNYGGTTGASATDDNWANAGIKSCAGTAVAQGGSTSSTKCGVALDLLNSTDITSSVSTLSAGVVASGTTTINSVAYTAGLTNAAALFGFVNSGYYIAPFSFTPYACPTGSLCSGGEGLGDFADVDMPPTPCPAQTVLGKSGNSIASTGVTLALVGPVTCTAGTDCTGCFLAPHFYSTPTGQVGACPANYYCPGGGILGTQSPTSFLCTANSTIEACNTFMDNVQSSSYAAGSTTIAAAPAPNVTVTVAAPAITVAAPAVTVTPAPITVTPAPITVTPAAITVTPAPITVNAPVASAASTRSSALVLVLAALAALAAF